MLVVALNNTDAINPVWIPFFDWSLVPGAKHTIKLLRWEGKPKVRLKIFGKGNEKQTKLNYSVCRWLCRYCVQEYFLMMLNHKSFGSFSIQKSKVYFFCKTTCWQIELLSIVVGTFFKKLFSIFTFGSASNEKVYTREASRQNELLVRIRNVTEKIEIKIIVVDFKRA